MGRGIYGGELLGHACCGGVEIDEYCQSVLKQRQKDGWMSEFEIYGDLTKLSGEPFVIVRYANPEPRMCPAS